MGIEKNYVFAVRCIYRYVILFLFSITNVKNISSIIELFENLSGIQVL